ncbi:MAG: putative lipoprotein [Arenicella sp.]|jgi:uncharacterized lipoprotein
MNKFAINRGVVRNAALLVLVSILIGCGGSKTVITADDSAEYRNAVSLPPLKKPTAPSVISSAADSVAVTAAIETPSASAEQSSSSDKAPAAPENKPIGNDTSARVIGLEGDIARLKIDAGLDSAWSYLSEHLKRSDITVHSRSKTARRFSIGCASLQAKPTNSTKRGVWSFFAKKKKPTEHCSLLLASSRSATQVKLLNRTGAEYKSDVSKPLFARLLKN